MTYKQLPILLGLSLILAPVIQPLPSRAHSTMIEYQATEAITIQAKFDNGAPLSNAQVVVYAPDNPSEPWQKGMTDAQGKFTFIPDYQNQGNWSVKVRSAGHGNIINIPINSSQEQNLSQSLSSSNSEVSSSSSGLESSNNIELSLTQKLMMALMGAWGFVGTALFFSRKNKVVN
jgi:nickel transport protein